MKTFLLNLDADGVYFGATEIHQDDIKPGDVVLDHAPDNPPGKYRWDGTALVVLPVSQHKASPGVPDLARAFDDLCAWLSDNGELPLPGCVPAWRAWYRTTIDHKKSVD